LNDASYLAIDGNNSLWVANLGGITTGTSPNTTTTYGVSQFANNGNATAATALSPATTGYVHTMSAPNDIAIDGSGNVWVVNGGAVNYVTEIVGAATPTVTPIDYNIRYATWGQRP
jgi:secreted PhoX family phosphatase